MWEDKDEEEVEGVEEEEVEEALVQVEPKKRKAKGQPVAKTRAKKVVKPSPTKPTSPTTRGSTRSITKKAKEQAKEKAKTIGHIQLDTDDEKIESKDTSQFRVVIHTPQSDLENIYENVRSNADLSGLKNIDFEKLSREEKNLVEDLVYATT